MHRGPERRPTGNERSFARLSAPNTAETARQARHLQNHERTGAHPPMHHGARPRQAPPGRPPRHGGHGQEAARPSPVSGINPCVPRRCAAPSEEEGGASLRDGFLGSFGPPVAEGKQWLLLPRRGRESGPMSRRKPAFFKNRYETIPSSIPSSIPPGFFVARFEARFVFAAETWVPIRASAPRFENYARNILSIYFWRKFQWSPGATFLRPATATRSIRAAHALSFRRGQSSAASAACRVRTISSTVSAVSRAGAVSRTNWGKVIVSRECLSAVRR
jgi:hypothetical protein